MMEQLLSIANLEVTFPHRLRDFVAVKNFNLTINKGEIVGLIGESGAGKSTVGNAIIGLLSSPGRITSGQIKLEDQDLTSLTPSELAGLRGKRIGMIFQDPMTSLNPLMTIGQQLVQSIAVLKSISKSEAREEAIKRLSDVGIADAANRIDQYPHEYSGGMRQRVVIALALAGDPDLLIADEPTTALDVSVQKQILDLIKDICRERSLGVILVTHDMGVIAETADRVCVMRYGELIETGVTDEVLSNPSAEYTSQLISAIPSISEREERFRNPERKAGKIDQWLLQSQSSDSDGCFLKTTPLIKEFVAKGVNLSAKHSIFRAVDVPEIQIGKGEVLGLVGESGSGKSTLGRLLTGLIPITKGQVTYTDHGNITSFDNAAKRKAFRRDVQVVFQDPYSSLNSRLRVDSILSEPIRFHGLAPRSETSDLVGELLERVGLRAEDGRKYPHQFSGGQRQRICIARALAVKPRFILCDEPTSALDVSIQADMLALLMELKRSLGLTMLFVSHDLAVIRQVSDRVAVMKQGNIIEMKETEALFRAPEHEYTQHLLDTAPRVNVA